MVTYKVTFEKPNKTSFHLFFKAKVSRYASENSHVLFLLFGLMTHECFDANVLSIVTFIGSSLGLLSFSFHHFWIFAVGSFAGVEHYWSGTCFKNFRLSSNKKIIFAVQRGAVK